MELADTEIEALALMHLYVSMSGSPFESIEGAVEFARAIGQRLALRWSKALPTTPGWYWHKEYSPADSISKIFKICDYCIGLVIIDDCRQELTPIEAFGGFWSGPIPEPKEQK